MKKGKMYTWIEGSERTIIMDKGITLRKEVYIVGIRGWDLLNM
jgi:hypothetical protein